MVFCLFTLCDCVVWCRGRGVRRRRCLSPLFVCCSCNWFCADDRVVGGPGRSSQILKN